MALIIALALVSPLLPEAFRALGVPLLNDLTVYGSMALLAMLLLPGGMRIPAWHRRTLLLLLALIFVGAIRHYDAGLSPDVLRSLVTHFFLPIAYLLFISFNENTQI